MLNRQNLQRLSWSLMAIVFVVALVFGATDDGGPTTNAERSAALASTIACPQCSGQPVSESNAPVAEAIRTEIKTQVDDGFTDAEIRAFYVAQYGEWVDLNPSTSGLTGIVWVAPFLAIGVAVGGLALAFSRWNGLARSAQEATEEDHDLVAQAREASGGR